MQQSGDRRQAWPSTAWHYEDLCVHFQKQISYLNDLSCILSIWPHSAIFCTALGTSSCHQDLLEQPAKHNARAFWILEQNACSIAGATWCHMSTKCAISTWWLCPSKLVSRPRHYAICQQLVEEGRRRQRIAPLQSPLAPVCKISMAMPLVRSRPAKEGSHVQKCNLRRVDSFWSHSSCLGGCYFHLCKAWTPWKLRFMLSHETKIRAETPNTKRQQKWFLSWAIQSRSHFFDQNSQVITQTIPTLLRPTTTRGQGRGRGPPRNDD